MRPAKLFHHLPVLPSECWLLDRHGSPTAPSTGAEVDQQMTVTGTKSAILDALVERR